jgi:serine/threonine protein kinase
MAHCLDGWSLDKKLQQSLYGSIWAGSNNKGNVDKSVIIKRSDIKRIGSKSVFENPLQEAKMLRLCEASSHPDYFPHIYHEQIIRQEHFLVLEDCGHDLVSRLNEIKQFSETLARLVWTQLIDALNILHEETKLCHLDLKPDNICLTADWKLSLIDFGQCRPITGFLTGMCGTQAYRAPEVTTHGPPYDPIKADLFSCGTILLVMVTGMPTFNVHNTNSAMIWNLICGSSTRLRKFISKRVPHGSSELHDLLIGLLAPHEERLSLQEVRNHPWLHMNSNTMTSNRQLDDSGCDQMQMQLSTSTPGRVATGRAREPAKFVDSDELKG